MGIIAICAVLLSSGLWLPLGIAIGAARNVPEWSRCGRTLCLCHPEPVCPLCPVAQDGDSCESCDRGDAVVRKRLDMTPVLEVRKKCASAFLGGFFMVGVLGTEAVVNLPPITDVGRVSIRAASAPMPLHADVETPPPRV